MYYTYICSAFAVVLCGAYIYFGSGCRAVVFVVFPSYIYVYMYKCISFSARFYWVWPFDMPYVSAIFGSLAHNTCHTHKYTKHGLKLWCDIVMYTRGVHTIRFRWEANTKYDFLNDTRLFCRTDLLLRMYQRNVRIIHLRTVKRWFTKPKNYREIERLTSEARPWAIIGSAMVGEVGGAGQDARKCKPWRMFRCSWCNFIR